MDQNRSKWIKLDFWWNINWNISSDLQLHLFLARVLAKALKMLFWTLSAALIKFSTLFMFLISDEIIIEIHHQIFDFQSFFNQIESDLSKMDQTWSTSDEIIIEIYHQIFNFIHFWIRLHQICSKWSKMNKLDFWWLKCIIRFSTLCIFWSNWIRSFKNCQLNQYYQICNFCQSYLLHIFNLFNQLHTLVFLIIIILSILIFIYHATRA